MAQKKAKELTQKEINAFLNSLDRSESTTKTYRTNLNQFTVWLNYSEIREPTRESLKQYREWLLNEHYAIEAKQGAPFWKYQKDRNGRKIKIYLKSNTVVSYMRSVCQFFKWAGQNRVYENIAETVHAPKVAQSFHRKEALKPEQVRHIIETLKQGIDEAENSQDEEKARRNYAMFTLAVNAGLRTIELNRLNLNDLETDHDHAIIYIWGKGHGGADQRMLLADEVAQILKEYLKVRTGPKSRSAALFTATGNRSHGERIAVTTISKILKEILKNAGYDSDKLTAHSLRHTSGTNTMAINGNVYEIQQYMRHKNPSTTEIYLHGETEQRQLDLAEQLYKLYTTPQDERK